MKLRKLTAFLLVTLLVLPLLVGCAEALGDADQPSKTTEDPYAPLTTEKKDYSAAVGMTISVVANGVNMGKAFSADVCDAYQGILGELVNVRMEDMSGIHVCSGDELRVKVDRVDATTPPTVHAAKIELVAYGKYHEGDDEYMIPGYGFGPYTIPDLSEISINEKMPSANALKNAKDSKDTYRLRSYDWTDYGALRVIRVADGIVYLAAAGSRVANMALVGIPKDSFRVGDHVNVDVLKYYQENESWIEVAYLEDVIAFKLLTEEETHRAYRSSHMIDKPVIYLYPEEETVCSVKVDLDGTLTCTYPEHGKDGWQNFTAQPDGTLIFPDGKEYYCLYWEGKAKFAPDFSKGFCVKGSDTADFLAEILPELGLTDREANEFIIYWLPILQKNPYTLISFQSEAYTSTAELEISPAPDSLLRVYMAAKPLTAPVEIEPQTFDGFERIGFTVVEWGGSIIEE